jgi:hypothetical protein
MRTADLPRPGTRRYRLRSLRHHLEDFFPDSPEGDLWLAVLMQAADDASDYVPGRMNSFFAADAYEYLTGEVIPACELCGVNTAFARRVLIETGVLRWH